MSRLAAREPPAPPPPPRDEAPGGPQAAGVGARCALLVDDDDLLRLTMADVLEGEGWQVLHARDGLEALEVLQRARPHLVVLDHRMPRLSGADLYRRLREQGVRLPVVLVTAAAAVTQLAADLGIRHHLAKPFALEEFLTTVERAANGD